MALGVWYVIINLKDVFFSIPIKKKDQNQFTWNG